MNLEKLAKQLRRDLAANPKKATALGLMVLVALYFWGPIVWGFAGSPGKNESKVEPTNVILTDDPLEQAGKAKARNKPKFRWEKVRPQLAVDKRMATATFEDVWIDPFRSSGAAGDDEAADRTATATMTKTNSPAAPGAPAELGLALTSIAIGSQRRAATISGERYYVGDEVVAAGKDNVGAVERFRVVRITPQGVELQSPARIVVLPLSRSKLASGDTIARTKENSDR